MGVGTPGPPGAQGPQGVGFTNFDEGNLFVESNPFDHQALGSGVQYSWGTTMAGSEIMFLTGGLSEWYSSQFDSDDHFQIDNIVVVNPSGTQVRMDCRVPTGGDPRAQVRFFMNAATR